VSKSNYFDDAITTGAKGHEAMNFFGGIFPSVKLSFFHLQGFFERFSKDNYFHCTTFVK